MAGIRFVITVVVLTLALFVEYAFSDGGVLRWLMSLNSTAPAAESTAAVEAPAAQAQRPAPRPAPAEPEPAPVVEEPAKVAHASKWVALPIETSFEDEGMGWEYDPRGGDGIGARTTDGAHDGRYSVFSLASSAANRGWPGWVGMTRLPVAPGQTYVFRAWAASADGASAWLDIGMYDKSGTWLGGRSSGCAEERPRPGGWERLELRYVNDDPRVAWVRLSLLHCLNHSEGYETTLYFDDVSFAAAAGPRAPAGSSE